MAVPKDSSKRLAVEEARGEYLLVCGSAASLGSLMSELFRRYAIVADVNIFVGKADGRVVHNFIGLTFRDVAVFTSHRW